jgi:hypothetical protein
MKTDSAVRVPAGSQVKVQARPSPFDHGMVVVLVAGRELAIFAKDLVTRGETVLGANGS